MASSSAYKGGVRPRLVTPCSLSEWMPTSIVGLAVLAHQICPNTVLLLLGPSLSQPQMVDLTVCLGCLEPPFAEASFHMSRLDLLLKEIDLGAQ